MTFSYTDDAIVSHSPTGRHLSTVIRRPVVLMSGWEEHAEEICKVLNELQPSGSIGESLQGPTIAELIGSGYLAGRPGKQHCVILDFTTLEERAANSVPDDSLPVNYGCPFTPMPDDREAEVQKLRVELEELRTQLKAPVELDSITLAALASARPGSFLLPRRGSNAPTLKRV